jgi:hypothetical protein
MSVDFYYWQSRLTQDGFTYGLRLELVELLRPHVRLKPPFRITEHDERGELVNLDAPERIKDVVDWEVVLGTSDVHESLSTLRQSEVWQSAFPLLLSEFTTLLREALDLMRQL